MYLEVVWQYNNDQAIVWVYLSLSSKIFYLQPSLWIALFLICSYHIIIFWSISSAEKCCTCDLHGGCENDDFTRTHIINLLVTMHTR